MCHQVTGLITRCGDMWVVGLHWGAARRVVAQDHVMVLCSTHRIKKTMRVVALFLLTVGRSDGACLVYTPPQ